MIVDYYSQAGSGLHACFNRRYRNCRTNWVKPLIAGTVVRMNHVVLMHRDLVDLERELHSGATVPRSDGIVVVADLPLPNGFPHPPLRLRRRILRMCPGP